MALVRAWSCCHMRAHGRSAPTGQQNCVIQPQGSGAGALGRARGQPEPGPESCADHQDTAENVRKLRETTQNCIKLRSALGNFGELEGTFVNFGELWNNFGKLWKKNLYPAFPGPTNIYPAQLGSGIVVSSWKTQVQGPLAEPGGSPSQAQRAKLWKKTLE